MRNEKNELLKDIFKFYRVFLKCNLNSNFNLLDLVDV